jgi:hypothetical protein
MKFLYIFAVWTICVDPPCLSRQLNWRSILCVPELSGTNTVISIILSRVWMTIEGVGLGIGFIGHFNATGDYSLQITITHTHTSVLSHGSHQSSGDSFQRQTFLFLWVPKPSSCLSHCNYLFTAASRLHLSSSYLTTDGQSASLIWYQATIWDPRPIFLSLRGNYFQTFTDFSMGSPLWWEDEPVIYFYKCYWALPALSLSGHSPSELETISYCLIWDWVPFLSLLTTRRDTVEVS